MTSAKKPFEIREARASGTKATAIVYVDPAQPGLQLGAEFRLRGRDIAPAEAAGVWKIVNVVKVAGTGLWAVDFDAVT